MQFEEGKELKKLTTFGIGGRAKFFKEVSSVSDLQKILQYCHLRQLRYMILGKGSNVLFDDTGFDGLVILNKILFCQEDNGEFFVGSGYSFSLLGIQTARKGWSGLEFASGIPGSVGGAVYMNAGANEGEAFQYLTEVTFIDQSGHLQKLSKEKLEWGYRFSSFQKKGCGIAAARFKLNRSQAAKEKQLSIIHSRLKKQPYQEFSCGCVFRNPPRFSAGALIEQCGLKGFRWGGAEVSHQHANFIINKDAATTQDVINLVHYVQQVVYQRTGEKLEMEIEVIPS